MWHIRITFIEGRFAYKVKIGWMVWNQYQQCFQFISDQLVDQFRDGRRSAKEWFAIYGYGSINDEIILNRKKSSNIPFPLSLFM